MNKSEIKRMYTQLIREVQTNEFYTKKRDSDTNVYRCPKGHLNKTIDVDPGVTPFFHQCKVCRDACVKLDESSLAQSTFYNDVAPNLKPSEEWFRPTLQEALKLNDGELEHLFNGGLFPRDIKPKKDA